MKQKMASVNSVNPKNSVPEAKPLLGMGNPLDDYSQFSEDPLLSQLPKELLKYVVRPQEHKDNLEYVKREGLNDCSHRFLSALSYLLCCYGAIRQVTVKEGELCLTQNGPTPEIIGPGRHVLLSPFNTYKGIVSQSQKVVIHGPIHVIQVQIGELGYGVDIEKGKPVLLSQGKHIINSATFQWKKFISLRDPITKLEQIEIVRVETGYVGYCYRRGKLQILNPGMHLVQPPDRVGSIFSTQISILQLPEQIHETSDYVPLAVKAAVFYRIKDPLKALTEVKNIQEQIKDTAIATLAGIIRGSSLSDVASRSKAFYHKESNKEFKTDAQNIVVEDVENTNLQKEDILNPKVINSGFNPYYGGKEPSAPAFFEHVHDEFMNSLHDRVLKDWGIEIHNIRIESLKISDAKLQSDISQQAIEVSNIHNKFLMLQKNKEIETVKAETEALKVRIKTDSTSDYVRRKAQADADAVIIAAKAEKEALELKGQGECEYSKLISSTQLGKEIAKMKIQASALNGVNQVAYVPHLPKLFEKTGIFMDSKSVMPH